MGDCILADRGFTFKDELYFGRQGVYLQRKVGISRCYTEGSTFYKGKISKAIVKCENSCRKGYWTIKEISHVAEYCATHTNRFS